MPYIQSMCPSELEDALKKKSPLFISAGSVEYHGSQLPLGTDLLIIEGLLREIEKRVPIVIAPPFTYSPTGYMVSGTDKGTVDISVDGFVNYCSEILSAYVKMGFETIYLLVHHQGGSVGSMLQTAALKINAYDLYRELGEGWWTDGVKQKSPCRIEVAGALFGDDVLDAFGGHGGKGETQAIMAFYPELVHMEKLTEDEPFWNETVNEANVANARNAMEKLVSAWVEKLKD